MEINKKIIKIFVFNLKEKKINKDKINELEHIICPICKELIIINHNDLKIFNNCKKCNLNYKLDIKKFIESQYTDESNIKCIKCGNKKKIL